MMLLRGKALYTAGVQVKKRNLLLPGNLTAFSLNTLRARPPTFARYGMVLYSGSS